MVSLRALTALVLAAYCFVLIGCGKYGRPLPPEAFSPQSVRMLQVFPELNGVRFTWNSPKDDLRGEELESLDGYEIMRKTITKDSDILDADIEFETIATIQDESVTLRELARDVAIEAGRPARKIKSNPDLEKFEFIDTEVTPGEQYLYKIVPLNQNGVEGQVLQQVRVMYRGVSSVVVVIDNSQVGEALDGGNTLTSPSQVS